jgi:hypothetical protein
MVSRTPPIETRRILRSEVNFGCPVKDCGSPFLTYHHFDPTWEPAHVHNVSGMIALCSNCHKKADQGVWTISQLKDMKNNPFLKDSQVAGRLDWLRQNIMYIAGSNFLWNVKTILSVDSEGVIWVNRDSQNQLLLNCKIFDIDSNLLLEMIDNDWTVYNPEDLECLPGGQRITIKGNDNVTNFYIDFKEVTQEDFYKEWQPILERSPFFFYGNPSDEARQFIYEILSYVDSPNEFVICTINGQLRHRNRNISFTSNETAINGRIHFGFNFVGGADTVFSF